MIYPREQLDDSLKICFTTDLNLYSFILIILVEVAKSQIDIAGKEMR